ncbi:hypothetical protein [Xenorhabdus bovienii]|uniref:hypothetical protein n=1 Tax=Xenorhabdus bovienii TaxID=40576 RepID=UPI0023B2B33C|nr:hypothetical protein [Xenorhabdus bovienii]
MKVLPRHWGYLLIFLVCGWLILFFFGLYRIYPLYRVRLGVKRLPSADGNNTQTR